jgi:hypothetical protein
MAKWYSDRSRAYTNHMLLTDSGSQSNHSLYDLQSLGAVVIRMTGSVLKKIMWPQKFVFHCKNVLIFSFPVMVWINSLSLFIS